MKLGFGVFPDVGGRGWFLSVSLMVGFLWRAGRSAILGCVDRVNMNKYVYILFGTVQIFHAQFQIRSATQAAA